MSPDRTPVKKTSNIHSFKDAYHHVAPEDIELGKDYTFNVNLNEKLAKMTQLESFYKMVRLYGHYLTMNVVEGMDFRLHAELSKSGKLHYHGTICFFTNMAVMEWIWKLRKLQNHFTYNVDVINDAEKWNDYRFKQRRLMEPFCRHYKVPYTLSPKSMTELLRFT